MSESIIYARVSTEEQARKGFSIPSQLEHCRNYCIHNAYPISMELTDDESGGIMGRDGLTRLRELVAAGAIRRIVVWRQDRLARDELSYFTLRAEFRRHGVEVHSVSRGGQVDGLYASLEAVLDADEKDRIRDRTMRGRKDKALRGKIIGHGPAPYGYIRSGEGENVQWELDETAARVVAKIFDWYVHLLMTPAAIAVRLTEEQAPTPSQRRPEAGVRRKNPPGHWNRESVRLILRNPSYAGTFYAYRTEQPRGEQSHKRPAPKKRPRSEWIPIPVPAIVDQALFDAAQHRLDAAPQLAFRNTQREYLVGRRVRCSCGKAATGATSSLSGRNTRRYPYYSCNSRRRGQDQILAPCGIPPFRGDVVDAMVWQWVRRELLDHTRLQENMTERDKQRMRHAKVADPSAKRRASLEKLHAQRERLNRAYVAGLMAFEEYEPQKRSIDREIAEIEALPAAPAPIVQATAVFIGTLIDQYQDDIDNADFRLRRFMIDHLDIHTTLCLIEGKKYLRIRTEALDLEVIKPLEG